MRQRRPPARPGTPSWAVPAIILAVIVAAGIAFAGFEIGKGSSRNSSTPTAAVPPASPHANPGAPATPGASATTSASATPTGAATPAVSVTVTGTVISLPPPAAVRVGDEAIIRGRGYVAGAWQWTSDGAGGRILAWRATCADSPDHYCQEVFFFHNATLIGTDTAKPSRLILKIQATGGPAIAVTYANYKPSDANCCPSGKPVSITYTWNGVSMTPSGVPPGQ